MANTGAVSGARVYSHNTAMEDFLAYRLARVAVREAIGVRLGPGRSARWRRVCGLALRVSLAGLAALSVASCGAGQGRKVRPSASNSSVDTTGDAEVANAAVSTRWWHHPVWYNTNEASVLIGDGLRLMVGDQGRRWLWNVVSDTVTSAPMLAGEALVAAFPQAAGGYLFVGQRGSVFRSEQPLGPLTWVRSLAPTIRSAVTAGNFAVLLQSDGQALWTRDRGATFAPLALPRPDPLTRVVLLPTGQAMLLGFPERLWISQDLSQAAGGFSPVELAPVGASRLMSLGSDLLAAVGESQAIVWSAGQRDGPQRSVAGYPVGLPSSRWVSADVDQAENMDECSLRSHRSASTTGSTVPEGVFGPLASSLRRERAKLTSDQYVEVRRTGRFANGYAWEFGWGRVGESIAWNDVSLLRSCADARLAMAGKRMVVLCLGSKSRLNPAVSASLLVSVDGGAEFRTVRRSFRVDPERATLALGATGQMIMTGVCVADSKTEVCEHSGVQRWQFDTSASPEFVGSVKPVAWPSQVRRITPVIAAGERFYAVGLASGRVSNSSANSMTRDANLSDARPHNVLLVSNDEADEFRAVALREGRAHVSELAATPASGTFPVDTEGTLTLGPDGRFAWVLQIGNLWRWFVLEGDGTLVSHRREEAGVRSFSAAGAYALRWQRDGTVMETTDGGRSFRRVGTVDFEPCWSDVRYGNAGLKGYDVRSCDRQPESVAELHCGHKCVAAGCVFGQDWTRVGWGGTVVDNVASTPGTAEVRSPADTGPTKLGKMADGAPNQDQHVVATCKQATKTSQGALAGGQMSLSVPELMRGEVDWVEVVNEAATSRVYLALGLNKVTGAAAVQPVNLMAPVANSDVWNVKAFQGIQGIAVLRRKSSLGTRSIRDYAGWRNRVARTRVTEAAQLAGKQPVEIAWYDMYRGKVMKIALASAEVMPGSDADAWSVIPTGSGVAIAGNTAELLYLQPGRTARVIELPPRIKSGNQYFQIVDTDSNGPQRGEPMAFGYAAGMERVWLRQRGADGSQITHLHRVFPKDVPGFKAVDSVDLVHRASGETAVVMQELDTMFRQRYTWVLEPVLTGAARSLSAAPPWQVTRQATFTDLTFPFRTCTGEQMGSGYRVASDVWPQQLYVHWRHKGETTDYPVTQAITYGEPHNACVAAWVAQTVQGQYRHTLLVRPDATARSWHITSKQAKPTEWRELRCNGDGATGSK